MQSIKQRIIELRNAIRYIRDQNGDDRCWLDYRKGYALLHDTNPEELTRLPNRSDGMRLCTLFYEERKSQASSIPRNLISQDKWDKDLEGKSEQTLQLTLQELETAWRKHRETPIEKLTLSHDRALYQVLPEYGHTPVDFTLPPRAEFLGTKKEGAGCPNFWTSHANCKSVKHDPHGWGPCDV